VLITLTTHAYHNESLPITGPEALSFAEVTAKMGGAIGSPPTFQPSSDEEARRRHSRTSGSAEETDAHVALGRAIREGRLAALNRNVERTLGRKPIGLDQWPMENAGAFR